MTLQTELNDLKEKQCKWYIGYNYISGQFCIDCYRYWYNLPLSYFPTREAAQAAIDAIDAIGVDDLKIMFGVK